MTRFWLWAGASRLRWLPLVVAVASGCAHGSPAAPRLASQIEKNADQLFALYDRDHDHHIDPGEALRLSLVGQAFAAVDRDADGAISHDEFLAPARIAELEQKFRAFTDGWLAVSDQDGDGRLSRSEYNQATLGPQPGVGAMPFLDPAGAAFTAADGNQDGILVPEEALALVGWLIENGWRLAPRGGAPR